MYVCTAWINPIDSSLKNIRFNVKKIYIYLHFLFISFILEYASGGSLYEYLSSDASEEISMRQIMTWATEIAKGTHKQHRKVSEANYKKYMNALLKSNYVK